MANLVSDLFRGEPRLEKCLLEDKAHVLKGDRGQYVALIQYAVLVLEPGTSIDGQELVREVYGADTAKAVLAYKTRRKIINPAYQTTADAIVGKMTIQRLDAEMLAFESREKLVLPRRG
jgi:hypothetical protein